jgi:hypothetical protein
MTLPTTHSSTQTETNRRHETKPDYIFAEPKICPEKPDHITFSCKLRIRPTTNFAVAANVRNDGPHCSMSVDG